MGRLSDIVEHGLRLEAEQETRDLMNESRKIQMEEIIRDRAQSQLRTTPGYVTAFDRFTDPETPTEELGKYAVELGDDIPDAMKARQFNQNAWMRNKVGIDRYMAELAAREKAREDAQAHAESMRQQGERERDERFNKNFEAVGKRFEDTNKRITDTAEANRTAAEEKAALAERNRQAGNIKEHQQQIARNVTTFSYDALEQSDPDTQKILKKRFNGADPSEVRKAIIAGSKNAADLIRAGLDPEDAYAAVSGGIVIENGKVLRTEIPIPEQLKSAGGGDIEAKVEAAIKKAGKDTPELREALRKRIAARGGN